MRIRPFIYYLCILPLISGCSHSGHNHGETEEMEHADEHHSHSGEIILEPEKAQAAGVRVENVVPGDFYGVVPVSGKVLTASGDESTVASTIAGIVSFARPITEGMAVGKGTALFSISTANLQDGDIVQRSRIAYSAAKAEYERAQSLVSDKIISEKDFLSIKADYENAALAYKAVANHSGSRGVSVSSPQGGYVKECLVKEGDYVDVGQPLMTVTQNKKLYLRAEVPERDFDKLNRISSARFKTSYRDEVFDLSELNGRLLSYGKSSAETSSFIPVTFEFDNRGGVIPGSFAEIFLIVGKQSNVISVPVTALTEEQGVHFVYIQVDDECYRKQEVKVGSNDGKRYEILSGLKPGDKLVVDGAIHVKLASAGKSIPGHTHNH